MTSTETGHRSLRIALVLGAGGARGYAHIGVIEELVRRGHQVVAVAGSSMGAVVGGLYAAGGLDEFKSFVSGLSRTDVLKYLDVTLRGPGVLVGERIMRKLHGIVGDVRLEDLDIPTTIIATDIVHTREVWFNRGVMLAAMRASIAIPTAFTPVSIGGRVLADGGVLNPLPIDAVLAHPSDVIIGVSLSGRNPGIGNAAPTLDTAEDGGVEVPWTERVAETLLATPLGRRIAPKPLDTEERPPLFDPLPATLTSRDMTTMALDTMQQAIEASRTAATPPDVHIAVPIGTATTFDFHRATELVELGRSLAVEAFDRVGI